MLSRIWRLAPARRSSPRRGAGVPAPGCESLCGPEDLKSLEECMLSRICRLAPARRSSPRRGAGVPARGCESLCGPEDLKSLQECMPAGVGSGTVLDVHGSGVIVHYKSLSPVPLRSTALQGDDLESASV